MTADTPPLIADSPHMSFGPTTALDGASLTVAAGEPVAVMGPSDSGRSTLPRCLAGTTRPVQPVRPVRRDSTQSPQSGSAPPAPGGAAR
jgi:ABC-type multidrug transport system ATPase subunit